MAVLHLHPRADVPAHAHLAALVATVLALVAAAVTVVALLLAVDRLTDAGVITLAPGSGASALDEGSLV